MRLVVLDYGDALDPLSHALARMTNAVVSLEGVYGAILMACHDPHQLKRELDTFVRTGRLNTRDQYTLYNVGYALYKETVIRLRPLGVLVKHPNDLYHPVGFKENLGYFIINEHLTLGVIAYRNDLKLKLGIKSY